MEADRSKLSRLLATLPAILLLTFANTFIGFMTAGGVFLLLYNKEGGVEKHLALGAAVVVAIAVHAYIVFNHKLRDYIRNQGKTNE
jgi:hypothetical protein